MAKLAATTAVAAAAVAGSVAVPAAHAATISAGHAMATQYTHTATTPSLPNNLTPPPADVGTPTSHSINAGISSASNGAAKVTPNWFIGYCITWWSTSSNWAWSDCTNGLGLYNQFIHCAGITRPVLGPVIDAPSIYIGYCPAGHNVIDAGVDF